MKQKFKTSKRYQSIYDIEIERMRVGKNLRQLERAYGLMYMIKNYVIQISKIVMGNKHCQHGYSFESQYDILLGGSANNGVYKLQSRQNRQLYVGRQLISNDQHQTYELECIVHEKLKNPSPFLTRLLKADSDIQDSYCSTSNKFYLLFKQVPWLLADEIGQRSAHARSFSIQQIEAVISRVSKAIRYLYDIFHHHGVISTKSITWPINAREPGVQLVDQWMIGADGNFSKHRIFRPKDEVDMNEKLLEKANDLYSLGIVAKQMLGVGVGNNREKSLPTYDRLNSLIQILLAPLPQDRFRVFNMITTSTRESQAKFEVPTQSMQVLRTGPNAQINVPLKIQATNNNHNISYQNIRLEKNIPVINLPNVALRSQPIYPQIRKSTFQKSGQISSQFGVNFTNGEVRKVQPRRDVNINLGSSKANNIFNPAQRIFHKQQIVNRNHSMGKITLANTVNNQVGQIYVKAKDSLFQTHISPGVGSKPIINFNGQQDFSRQQYVNKQVDRNFLATSAQINAPLVNISFAPSSNVFVSSNNHSYFNNIDSGSSTVHLSYGQNQGSNNVYEQSKGSFDDQNLFTPPDFFLKIRQTNSAEKQAFPPAVQTNEQTKISSYFTSAESEKLKKEEQVSSGNSKNAEICQLMNVSNNNLRGDRKQIVDGNGELYKLESAVGQQTDLIEENKNKQDFTPAKNSRSNQPFSTIPEVSERSASARSDDDKQYVIEQYENGSRYEGFKSNGMRNGKGKFFYQEGSFYDGDWKNNNMHGYGRLFYSNNKLAYEGEWFIDQFHGRGKVFNDEPVPIFGFFDYTNFDNLDQKWKYYQGDLVCDSKEGFGKLLLSNDEYYDGQFKSDKVDGKGKFVTKDGEIITGIWEQSKLVRKL